MFLTAVILILFFSLSDLAKWMNQNGDTYALREFINLEKLCMLICFDTESKNKSIKLYYISMLFYSKFSFFFYTLRFQILGSVSKKLDVLNLYKFLYIQSFCCDDNSIYFSCNRFFKKSLLPGNATI